MRTIALGSQGLKVSVEGFGAMGMSAFYGARDDAESVATLNRAVDLGVTHIDTAEAYGPFENEKLIARALGSRRDEITIASKWARDFDPDGHARLDGRPEHARRAIERSLTHLGVDTIDLYYLHRVDPDVPIEESVGAMAAMVEQGKVRYLGLSEAAPDTIRRAHAVHPLTAVQSEYSLFERGVEHNEVLATVRELGIGFVAFSPLGRGFLSGQIRSVDDLDADDARRGLPRFTPENIAANLAVVEEITALAGSKSATASQLALAWLIAQGAVPIAGTKRRRYLEENAAAADVVLTDEDLTLLDKIAPFGIATGERDTPDGLKSTYR
jgi:aryl-alcohol dehydrogenase-like predicted oxidoreductase